MLAHRMLALPVAVQRASVAGGGQKDFREKVGNNAHIHDPSGGGS